LGSVAGMTPAETEQSIARESEKVAAVVDAAALDDRVPGCPDWSLRDLIWHLGNVQRFWATTIRAGADVQPADVDEDAWTGPGERAELAAWMRSSTSELLDALRATAYDAPAWAWWRDDHTVGAIARHQVQEAAVHRWDAQSAGGTPEALPQPEADDGVDEFVWIYRQFGEPASMRFVATDSGLTVSTTDAPPAVTVSATASDLVLLLYGRASPAAVAVEGDRSVLEQNLEPVQ
jgi:uncharacterized protein (TIGR03083 family)